MTLNNFYKIATHHQRSARIDVDLTPSFFDGLVYHGTAQRTIETICSQYQQSGQRAFTVTGPYGSGKSTITLLISGLLHPNVAIREAARGSIQRAFPATSTPLKIFDSSFKIKKGWVIIRAVGGSSSPVNCMWQATIAALSEHGHLKNIVTSYRTKKPVDEHELVILWDELFNELKELVDGVFIFADEMGKMLDHINKNKGEMHVFQEIGERVTRMSFPILFLGLLHQTFSEYAKGRGSKKEEEWAKIQGRYCDVLFNVTTDETVSIISSSIKSDAEPTVFQNELVGQVLIALGLDETRTNILGPRLVATAPLHPLTAIILGPLAKRSFSQNERSTFGFLNSNEPASFNVFLNSTTDNNSRYGLEHLWDYLDCNLQFVIANSRDGHGWMMASDTIQRVERMIGSNGITDESVRLLKNIAIINLFGRAAFMFANENVLACAMQCNEKQLINMLGLLSEKSVITYRKHLNAWELFEGSDININELLSKMLAQVDSDAKVIESLNYSEFVMANGHYHEKGTIRWVKQCVVYGIDDIDEALKKAKKEGAFACFILVLDQYINDEKLKEVVNKRNSEDLALVSTSMWEEILELARDVYALELIKHDKVISAAMQTDRIAMKEFEYRHVYTKNQLREKITFVFRDAIWITKIENDGKLYQISFLAKCMADDIYSYAPKIHNEIVNRNKISASAVSASKKLLEAMLFSGEKEALGITGFPPEKAIYMSLLRNSGLHYQEKNNNWIWLKEHNKLKDSGLKKIFSDTTQYLYDQMGKFISIAEIRDMWASTPYGLTKGVFPILFMAYSFALRSNVAFYEKAISGEFEYLPEVDVEYAHKLQKSPEELAIKYFEVNGAEQRWLNRLADVSAELSGKEIDANFIDIATPLVTIIHGQLNWVKQIHAYDGVDADLNRICRNVREVLLRANDPLRLLTADLPYALDPDSNLNEEQKIALLRDVLKVITSAQGNLLSRFITRIGEVCPVSEPHFLEMTEIVQKNAADWSLKTFAREIANYGTERQDWVISVITTLGGAIIQNWNEHILKKADNTLESFTRSMVDIYNSYRPENIVELEHTASVNSRKLKKFVAALNEYELDELRKLLAVNKGE
ncbi:MAG: hypothetical protein ACRC6P_15870 [Shewanella oncorhynchi]